MKQKLPKEMKVTREMVGLKMQIRNCAHGINEGDFIVNVKFNEISDEGLEVFGLTEKDARA